MCNICKNLEAKFAMSGIDGKMCSTCHNNILKIRQGIGHEAKKYFDDIINNGTSEEAKRFILEQFQEYKVDEQTENQYITSGTQTHEEELSGSTMVWPSIFSTVVIILDILAFIGGIYLSIMSDNMIPIICVIIEIMFITPLAFSIKEIAKHIENIENNR